LDLPKNNTSSPRRPKANESVREMEMFAWESSSLLWVCSSNQGHSHVAILDANNPNSVVDTFPACIREVDYVSQDKNWKDFCRGGGYVKDLPPDMNDLEQFGAVQWVELRRLDSDEDTALTYCGPDQKPSPQRSRDFSVCEQATPGTSGNARGLNEVAELVKVENGTTAESEANKAEESGIIKRYILLEKLREAAENGVFLGEIMMHAAVLLS
uniref:DPPIV_N domain-containing protein n=1 Tax=Gongylonema pulchrum TaxID=637853 RepID=A0A183EIY8_9BILA